MVIALIALATFVVLLSVQVCFAQAEIKSLKIKHEALKDWTTNKLAGVVVCLKKLESEVEENEQH
jgi:hypothetical protein